jgi:hypothetical protein
LALAAIVGSHSDIATATEEVREMIHKVRVMAGKKVVSEFDGDDDTATPNNPSTLQVEIWIDQHYGIRIAHVGREQWTSIQFREANTWSSPVDTRALARDQLSQPKQRPRSPNTVRAIRSSSRTRPRKSD